MKINKGIQKNSSISEELKSQAQLLQALMNRFRLRSQKGSEVGSEFTPPEWETDRARLIAE